MVLELPTYKWPSLRNALLTAKDQGLSFLQTAGTVIMAICIVMWWLSAYPQVDAAGAGRRAARAAAAAPGVAPTQRAALDRRGRRARGAGAAGGQLRRPLGRSIQPVFAPLGFDWQLTVGILTSFLAREVFVSTMSVLVGGPGEADVDEGVVDRIRAHDARRRHAVFTPATAASALVFFVLAMQCLPTLTVTRKETGSFRYAVLQLGYMSGLAYVAALIVYQALRAAGVA